jgi:hypothetical protein
MSLELIIMPILSMLGGIASLFIDPKDKQKKWGKLLMSILIVAPAMATIAFGYQKEQESTAKELRSQADINSLKEENKKLHKDIIDTPQKTVDLLRYGYTKSSAQRASSEQVSQSKEANIKLDTIQESGTNRKINRSTITVEYFPKDIDSVIVKSTLETLGFNSKIGKAKNSLSTNAIWFGSNVNIEDVKLVAYTLIRAGIQIKTIRPFNDNSSNIHASLIQVGADVNYENKSPLSVDKIRKTSEFRRDR